MPKPWTDAKFEVVNRPSRKELPEWFKRAVMLAASVFMLCGAIYRGVEGQHARDRLAAQQVEAGRLERATAEPVGPVAR